MLEGGDQYRGWFRSSLITGGRDQGPRAVPPRREERLGERRAGPRDVEVARHRHRRARGDGAVGRRRPAAVGRFGRVYRRRALRPERRRASRPRLPEPAQPHALHALEPRRLRARTTSCAREAMEPIDRLACTRRRRLRSRASSRRTTVSRFTMRTCASSSSKARCRASTSTR